MRREIIGEMAAPAHQAAAGTVVGAAYLLGDLLVDLDGFERFYAALRDRLRMVLTGMRTGSAPSVGQD